MFKNNFVLVRGGGDLATGVALRLHRAGIKVLIAELAQPLAVRRTVSFSEAVYDGRQTVEGVTAKLIEANQLPAWEDADFIPVIVDPDTSILVDQDFVVVIDARLIKTSSNPLPKEVPLHIGLGPGFHAGRNCHAVIETHRSHTLGRVHWTGTTQPDSGEPEGDPRRVLRAPMDGVVTGLKKIGAHVEEGEVIAEIQNDVILRERSDRRISDNTNETLRRLVSVRGVTGATTRPPAAQSDIKIISPFAGVLRGLIRDGLQVTKGTKIGDVDARDDASACFLVSDKSLAIGGGALEAVLSKAEIRKKLYSK